MSLKRLIAVTTSTDAMKLYVPDTFQKLEWRIRHADCQQVTVFSHKVNLITARLTDLRVELLREEILP